jgi:4-hydroxybenzoate polyprenyltransferase
MDFNSILNTVKEYVPVPVIVAVVAVIMLVYGSMFLASIIEDAIESKKNKQIKIFDHKKIWLSVFWCAVVSVALALAGFIAWRECVYYGLLILGASTFLYEAFLKKIGIKKEEA